MEAYKQELIRMINILNNGGHTTIIPNEVREVDKAVCWAWDNWDDKILSTYYTGDKPEFPPLSFITNWVENEDFEADGFDVEFLKEL